MDERSIQHAWGKKSAYKTLKRKVDGKGEIERHRRRREDSINMDFKEVGFI
jgi:hypothetical protein